MNKVKSWIIQKLGGYTEQLPQPTIIRCNLRPETFVVEVTYSCELLERFGEDFLQEVATEEARRRLLASEVIDRFIEWRFRQDGSGDFHCQARLSVVDMSEVRDYHVGFERTI